MLEIKNLTVQAESKIILNDFNIKINDNEIWAIMGPNGVGKSTICKVLLNHPNYQIINGEIMYNNKKINMLPAEERAKLGIFLLNQTPIAITGVTNSEMLRMAISNQTNQAINILEFHKELKNICQKLNISQEFIHREINCGMSGGERKKNELLHLWMLKPKFIILDEVDSGLDVDSFKIVMKSLKEYYQKYKPTILIVTHNTKVFNYLIPDKIAILNNGKISKIGDLKLANIIDEKGFESFNVSENEVYE